MKVGLELETSPLGLKAACDSAVHCVWFVQILYNRLKLRHLVLYMTSLRNLLQWITKRFGTLCFPGSEPVFTDSSGEGSFQPQLGYETNKALPIPWPHRSKQLEATGSLDFSTHTFPLLATIKRGTLEGAFTAEEIYSFGEVPACDVNQYLRDLVARKAQNCVVHEQFKPPAIDKYQATADERRYLYECFVDYTGQLTFQVSVQKQPYSLLYRTFGPDRVLMVTFGDDPTSKHDKYRRLAECGIFLGLRRYQYWVHKEVDKKRTKLTKYEPSASVRCYFVCTASLAATDLVDPTFKPFKSIADCRRHVMDIHMTESTSKYHSRLLLALSRTVKVDVDFELRVEEDLHCKDAAGRDLGVICTDGTGFISSDLAKLVPVNIYRGVQLTTGYDKNEVCPALMQIRIFRSGRAIKGTLGIDHRLPPRTIVCRKSMMKVRPDERPPGFLQVNSLELCNTSKRPHAGKLSRDLILVSTVLRIPGSFFLGVVQSAIDSIKEKVYDRAAAFEDIRWKTTDEADLVRRMLFVGMPLQEPFLNQSLKKATSERWDDLKKGRVELPDSYNLIGTADPTGTLQRHQVAITLSQGPLNPISCPKVAVYRTPGKHPGDVHIFEPTWNTQLQTAVGNSKYAIYFSTQGPHPVYEEIGNGDLDGDRYWICTHADFLLHLQESKERHVPRAVSSTMDKIKPADLPADELERILFNEFLTARFHSRPLVAQAANYWTIHMDRFLTLGASHEQERRMHWNKAMEAGHIFNEAVDSGKSGLQIDSQILSKLRPHQMPHYLQRTSTKKVEGYGTHIHVEKGNIYHSTSILGQIFDLATQAEAAWLSPPKVIELDPGFQFPNSCKHYEKWNGHYRVYRTEMMKTLQGRKPPGWPHRPTEDEIILKYKKILLGTATSQEERTQVLEESSAIYEVVYSHAKFQCFDNPNQVPRLSFAWRVAGHQLLQIYYQSQLPKEPFEPFFENQPQVPLLVSFKAYNELILRRESY